MGASDVGGVRKNRYSRPISGFGIDDWWSIMNSFDRGAKYITADADDDRHTSVNLVYDSKAQRRFCRAMQCISAAYAIMQCLSVCLSVCLCLSVCVCLSVCLSRLWVVSKRIKISFKFFHRRAATPFSVPNGMAMFRREAP